MLQQHQISRECDGERCGAPPPPTPPTLLLGVPVKARRGQEQVRAGTGPAPPRWPRGAAR